MPEPAPKRTLNLGRLLDGFPKALDPEFSAGCARAAAVCLENCRHAQGVEVEASLRLGAEATECMPTTWPPATDSNRRTWNDPEEAAKNGAYGAAFLLVMEFTDYVVIEQAYKGGGFDYWLGRDDDALFQGAARLEVSGTCLGRYEANSRKNKKLKQTDPSDATGLPAFVVVVDFKTPMAWVVRK